MSIFSITNTLLSSSGVNSALASAYGSSPVGNNVTFTGFVSGPIALPGIVAVLNSDGTQLQIPERSIPVSCSVSQAGSVSIVSTTLSVANIALGTSAVPLDQNVVIFDTVSALTPLIKAGGVCLPFAQFATSGNKYVNISLTDSASVGLLAGNVLVVKIQCIY